ncbi:MAG TPA: hemolysin family protein [Candidatus Corynebacterium avicola]|uniref:Hemolysin family protein n=1 Tax=Candidatus Corynebacterium avicola TaxID=2838527 RepID=A0A9D1RMF5_9CORY|nr:hemolysin family protein [Candidatus Corynebacterium avicola]
MNDLTVILATIALLVASAFFVMIEFALLGARRHRLEENAQEKASSRAALRGMNELTVMLAVAQLGITACTFALGAVTKPAVTYWIKPLFEAVGVPASAAYTVSFIVALLVVTFLHLVIGEMAPKSWAIAFPERAARLVSLPARALAWLLRPILLWMNRVANSLVSASGVEPVDRAAAAGYDADTLRHLVEHSAEEGALEAEFQSSIAGALELQSRHLGELPGTEVPHLPASATVAEVQDAARSTGQMRILLTGENSDITVVHVRDTLVLSRSEEVLSLSRPLLTLPEDMAVHEAFRSMRENSEQLVGVTAGAGDSASGDGAEGKGVPGLHKVVTLPEILGFVLPSDSDAAASPGAAS